MAILSRDLVCREVVALITDYLDGSLKRRLRRRLEAHLNGCPDCDCHLEQIQVTIRLVGHLDPEEVDPDAQR